MLRGENEGSGNLTESIGQVIESINGETGQPATAFWVRAFAHRDPSRTAPGLNRKRFFDHAEGAFTLPIRHDPFRAPPLADGVYDLEAGSGRLVSRPVQGFRFGKRDPTDKAKRLARVLVSDMIMYNAERHQSALAAGTLVQDFEDEIEKSWKEFVEQVGADLANGPGRTFWIEALNDILAKGQKVF